MDEYQHLTDYIQRYIFSKQFKNIKYLTLVAKKIFNLLECMNDNYDNEIEIKKIIINNTHIPQFIKSNIKLKYSYVTDKMVTELLTNYIHDGGKNNFKLILDPSDDELEDSDDSDNELTNIENYVYYEMS